MARQFYGVRGPTAPLLFEMDLKSDMEHIHLSKETKLKRALTKRVVPSSLIPLATGTGMLVLGSHKTVGPHGDCSFGLPDYLVYAGATSTSLAIVGIAGKYILEWILADQYLTWGEKKILSLLEYLGLFLGVLQVAIIMIGAVVIYPQLPYWQHDYKNLPNYCDYAMVVFSTIFITCTLVIVVICAVFAAVITYCDHDRLEIDDVVTSV